jgi:hypothetical protein
LTTTAGASVAKSADLRLQTATKADGYGYVSFVIALDVRFVPTADIASKVKESAA